MAESEPDQKFTVAKIQIKPGKSLKNQKDISTPYSTRLPIIPSRPVEYVPMPYIFRVPSASAPIKIKNLLAKSPPFSVLLDHTIAVIWMLFGNKEYDGPLGISQLQWALAFLKTIRNTQGEHPPDVETCINAIEQILLNQYSELSSDMNVIENLDNSVNYSSGAFNNSTLVVKNFPVSFNYAEMIDKCEQIEVQHAKSITSTQAEEELEKIKQAAGVESIESLAAGHRDQAMHILKMWKSDQLDKIKEGLRRLRSIEDKMKDIDDNFDGYIEDDLQALKG